MKKILLILLFISSFSFGQDYKLVKSEKSGKVNLIGMTNRSAYQDTNFAWWFNSEYKNYDVDTLSLDSAMVSLEDVMIKIVLGTWCSDSRREVPRFLKILDYLKFPEDKYLLINVDRDKNDLNGSLEALNIQLVPTIIFYKEGNELGRIIESPIESLEKDLVRIVKP